MPASANGPTVKVAVPSSSVAGASASPSTDRVTSPVGVSSTTESTLTSTWVVRPVRTSAGSGVTVTVGVTSSGSASSLSWTSR